MGAGVQQGLRRLGSGLAWHGEQVARASSRLVNAMLGGEGDTTFSAYSWHLAAHGRRQSSRAFGRIRVVVVDRAFGVGHCEQSWRWHQERGLFQIEK
jgi:hypothetical protein